MPTFFSSFGVNPQPSTMNKPTKHFDLGQWFKNWKAKELRKDCIRCPCSYKSSKQKRNGRSSNLISSIFIPSFFIYSTLVHGNQQVMMLASSNPISSFLETYKTQQLLVISIKSILIKMFIYLRDIILLNYL